MGRLGCGDETVTGRCMLMLEMHAGVGDARGNQGKMILKAACIFRESCQWLESPALRDAAIFREAHHRLQSFRKELARGWPSVRPLPIRSKEDTRRALSIQHAGKFTRSASLFNTSVANSARPHPYAPTRLTER
eukprot:2242908-Pleurochrysis_carterae.AAC.1